MKGGMKIYPSLSWALAHNQHTTTVELQRNKKLERETARTRRLFAPVFLSRDAIKVVRN